MQTFECVILAGGKGERLWPISQTRPKPLCRVGGVSCLERCVNAARAAGARKITVSACYLASKIADECKRLGVDVRADETPLGTAGACRECASGSETALVLSGDGVFDFDLADVIKRHFESKSECTVVLTGCETPTSYGCATVKDGVIESFDEKPCWAKIKGDSVNTGIYVLSPRALSFIPQNVVYDFASDLFPALFDAGVKITAYEARGFWCDIGDPEAYRLCCVREAGGNDISPSAYVARTASVHGSVVMDNARVCEGAVVDRAVIGENCVIGRNALVPAGCVLGDFCTLGEGASLGENVYLAANTAVEPYSYIKKDVRSGMAKGKLFDTDEGIGGVYGESFGASESLAAGIACAACAGRIAVMWEENAESGILAQAFITGVRAGGACAVALGTGSRGLAAFCGNEYSAELTAFFSCAVRDVSLVLCSRTGEKITGRTVDRIERAYRSQLTPHVPGGLEYPRGDRSPVCRFSAALAEVMGDLGGVAVNLPSFNPAAAVFRTLCVSHGAKVSQNAGASISFLPDGVGIMLTLRDGAVYERWQILSYVLAHGREKNIDIPFDAPISFENYLLSAGKTVERGGRNVPLCVNCAPFAAASLVAEAARKKRDLADIAKAFPVFTVRSDTVEFPRQSKAAFTGELCRECGNDFPLFSYPNGSVRYVPDSPRGFRVIAEAASAEYAEELCELGKRRITSPPPARDH